MSFFLTEIKSLKKLMFIGLRCLKIIVRRLKMYTRNETCGNISNIISTLNKFTNVKVSKSKMF